MTPLWPSWRRNYANVGFFLIALRTELGAMSSDHRLLNPILITQCRCFPHIINLACKAILAALTDLNYAREPITAEEHVSFLEAVDKDPIATIRALIHVVRLKILLLMSCSWLRATDTGFISSSSTVFANCQDVYGEGPSTPSWCRHTMVIRNANDWTCIDFRRGMLYSFTYKCQCDIIFQCGQCIESFLSIPEFHDLHEKYRLEDEEWNALSVAREILLVRFLSPDMSPLIQSCLGSIRLPAEAFSSKNPNALRCYSFIRSHDTHLEGNEIRVPWCTRIWCYWERSW